MASNQPRVWLITGASSGFGRAIAEAALATGDIVVAAARRTDALAELVASAPERVTALALDVTDADRIHAAVGEVLDWHGRVDVLVNNAGRGAIGAAEETSDSELRDLMDLHFFGPAALTRALLPGMRERGSGAIVQMSSMGGRFTFAGVGAYSATKFALEGWSEALAKEVGLARSGASLHLDGGFEAAHQRQGMVNAGLIANSKEPPRHRKTTKRGRKRRFNDAIQALRMRVERTFAWEDKFKRLLLRFERIQQRHYGMKLMAYTLINLRAFCGI